MKIEQEKLILKEKYRLCISKYGICLLLPNDGSGKVLATYESEKIMMEKLELLVSMYEERVR